MSIHKILILFIAFSMNLNVFSQESAIYTNHLADYQKALTLYDNQQYAAAQSLFTQIQKTAETEVLQSDCAFYIANCAVRLNQRNADQLMENFVNDYPTSTKRNTAYVDVAEYYFNNGKFANAKKWYDKVDESSLAQNEREKFNFNNGYVAFSTKNFKDARKYLTRVENSQKF